MYLSASEPASKETEQEKEQEHLARLPRPGLRLAQGQHVPHRPQPARVAAVPVLGAAAAQPRVRHVEAVTCAVALEPGGQVLASDGVLATTMLIIAT